MVPRNSPRLASFGTVFVGAFVVDVYPKRRRKYGFGVRDGRSVVTATHEMQTFDYFIRFCFEPKIYSIWPSPAIYVIENVLKNW